MINPYPPLPRDNGQQPLQNFPSPKKAVARYNYENAVASSVISVSHDTTTIEIAAVNGPAVLRWVPVTETAAVAPAASVITLAGTANFDHVIQSGTIRQFAIPVEVMFNAVGSVVGANRLNGLYQRYAIKSATAAGLSSVLSTEY